MEIDLKDYIKIIKHRIWIILACVALTVSVTGIVSYLFIDPVYQASTKLIVNKTNEKTTINQLTTADVTLNIQLINTYKEIIKTPAIMGKVAEQYPQLGMSTQQLINAVKVSSVNNTQVMTVVVQDKSYERARNIVNAVSAVFKQEIPQIMKVDNVSLLNEALPESNPAPVKPNPILNIAIAFVVSLMVSVGVAFLLEYLDDTIKTEEDVAEFLGLPTIGLISKIKDEEASVDKTKSSNRKVGENTNVTTNSSRATVNYSQQSEVSYIGGLPSRQNKH